MTAVASDWWGLHIATESGTMTHWNALSEEFEEGLERTPTNQRVERIVADGTTAVLMTNSGLVLVEASSAAHAQLAAETVVGISDVALDASGAVWASTFDDGLAAWSAPPGYQPVPSAASLRATPLNLGIGTGFADVTEFPASSTTIDLLNLTGLQREPRRWCGGSAHAHRPAAGVQFEHPRRGRVGLHRVLLWDGTFEMADDAFVSRLQAAVDTGRMLNGNLTVEAQLFSPVNGSMDVRLIYDWSRTETPIELLDLSDRPDDGGGAPAPRGPSSTTTISHGTSIYLKPDGWAAPPTAAELQSSNLQPDAAVALHSRLQADVFTAGGQPLIDGQDYSAVIVVEYADGRLGTPSMPSDLPPPATKFQGLQQRRSHALHLEQRSRWRPRSSMGAMHGVGPRLHSVVRLDRGTHRCPRPHA